MSIHKETFDSNAYKKNILHIDDDPQITRFVAERLQDLGYEVTSVNDPRQGVQALNRLYYRLVLLDIDMPYINGLDLLRQIKADHGGTQVIMVTGLVNMQTVLRSFRWGAEFCIFKPLIDMKPLVEAIERTFWKIDQWWGALHYLTELSGRKKQAAMAGGKPSDEPLCPDTADAPARGNETTLLG